MRNLKLTVIEGVASPNIWEAFFGPQSPDLGEGEIFGEPARDLDAVNSLERLPVREFRVVGDIGGRSRTCRRVRVV